MSLRFHSVIFHHVYIYFDANLVFYIYFSPQLYTSYFCSLSWRRNVFDSILCKLKQFCFPFLLFCDFFWQMVMILQTALLLRSFLHCLRGSVCIFFSFFQIVIWFQHLLPFFHFRLILWISFCWMNVISVLLFSKTLPFSCLTIFQPRAKMYTFLNTVVFSKHDLWLLLFLLSQNGRFYWFIYLFNHNFLLPHLLPWPHLSVQWACFPVVSLVVWRLLSNGRKPSEEQTNVGGQACVKTFEVFQNHQALKHQLNARGEITSNCFLVVFNCRRSVVNLPAGDQTCTRIRTVVVNQLTWRLMTSERHRLFFLPLQAGLLLPCAKQGISHKTENTMGLSGKHFQATECSTDSRCFI